MRDIPTVDPHHRLRDLDRCMFASNVPPDALHESYDGIYEGFYAWAARYSGAERRAMFHDVAARACRP